MCVCVCNSVNIFALLVCGSTSLTAVIQAHLAHTLIWTTQWHAHIDPSVRPALIFFMFAPPEAQVTSYSTLGYRDSIKDIFELPPPLAMATDDDGAAFGLRAVGYKCLWYFNFI